MWSVVPKECTYSFRCCVNLEEWLFLRKACLCLLYCFVKYLLVCPKYAFLQSGRVSLYTPESENLSEFWFLYVRWFWCYLCGRLFLCLSACICKWYMWFLYLHMWMWSICICTYHTSTDQYPISSLHIMTYTQHTYNKTGLLQRMNTHTHTPIHGISTSNNICPK